MGNIGRPPRYTPCPFCPGEFKQGELLKHVRHCEKNPNRIPVKAEKQEIAK